MIGSARGVVELEAEGGALRLEPDPRDEYRVRWTHCWLLTAGAASAPRYLGAEALDIIAGRLVANLADGAAPATGVLAGRPVRWVLTLADAWHQVFVWMDGADRVLLIMDPDGRPLEATLRLPEARYRRWREQLAPLARTRLP